MSKQLDTQSCPRGKTWDSALPSCTQSNFAISQAASSPSRKRPRPSGWVPSPPRQPRAPPNIIPAHTGTAPHRHPESGSRNAGVHPPPLCPHPPRRVTAPFQGAEGKPAGSCEGVTKGFCRSFTGTSCLWGRGEACSALCAGVRGQDSCQEALSRT